MHKQRHACTKGRERIIVKETTVNMIGSQCRRAAVLLDRWEQLTSELRAPNNDSRNLRVSMCERSE